VPVPGTGIAGGPIGRLLGLVDLPAPVRRAPLPDGVTRFDPKRAGPNEVDVVVLPDVFSAALDGGVETRALEVLAALGYRVAAGPFVASGKFDHVKGRRERFARAAAAQERLVRAVVDAGAVPVVIEPAVGLLHHHEYPAIHAGYPRSVRHLVEVIADRQDRLDGRGSDREVVLLAHCTERAIAPELPAAWTRVLEAAGYRVAVPDLGCCGMAGIFGHEVANQAMSRALWDLTWAAHLPPGPDGNGPDRAPIPAATGYSCRSQAKRLAGRRPAHPIELLGSGEQPPAPG